MHSNWFLLGLWVQLLAVATAMGATACSVAFLSQNLATFFLFLAVGEFFLFSVQVRHMTFHWTVFIISDVSLGSANSLCKILLNPIG